MAEHTPVLLKESLDLLQPKKGENFIDCTFGAGGHSTHILKKIKSGHLLGIEADKNTFAEAKENFSDFDNLILVNDNFTNLNQIIKNNFPYPVNGILFDLGLSSMELDKSTKGFSFLRDEDLDMRLDSQSQSLTAGAILNNYSEAKLNQIFQDLGEINRGLSNKITKAIVNKRKRKPFLTTFDLSAVILENMYPSAWQKGQITVATKYFYHHRQKLIHPATKFFQALRLEVNNELGNLLEALTQALNILSPGGRLVVISFHSLEDRIVKNVFRDLSKVANSSIKILTKKPIVPSADELKTNPRSRSAKLRAIIKT